MQFQHASHGISFRAAAVWSCVRRVANSFYLGGVQISVPGNFWRSLAAVLIGNALYFACSRFLPPAARHSRAGFDLGLVVDFWFCLVVLGLLELWNRHKKTLRGPR
jgi:purine-cytosine permease-like protein